jgi:hypothetical protein
MSSNGAACHGERPGKRQRTDASGTPLFAASRESELDVRQAVNEEQSEEEQSEEEYEEHFEEEYGITPLEIAVARISSFLETNTDQAPTDQDVAGVHSLLRNDAGGVRGPTHQQLVSVVERLSRFDLCCVKNVLPPGPLRGLVHVEIAAACKRGDIDEARWAGLRDEGVPLDLMWAAMAVRTDSGEAPNTGALRCLPDVLWNVVGSFLAWGDWARAAGVNKQWLLRASVPTSCDVAIDPLHFKSLVCPAKVRIFKAPRSITDAGLQWLTALTGLQFLDLAWCNNITDAGLRCLAPLASLQHLDLRECSNITDAGLQCLAPLTSLQHLDLRGCNNITDAGLQALREVSPGLNIER